MAWASDYKGQVTLAGLPVPGASVTGVQGAKKVSGVTDTQGLFTLPDLADGSCTVEVQMTGFTPLKQEVTVAPGGAVGKWELKVMSLDEIRAAAKPVKVTTTAPVLTAGVTTPAAGATPAKAAAGAKGKAAESGREAAPAEVASAADDAGAHSDGLLINGSQNNAAASQFSQAQAFGNSRNNGKSLYTGGVTVYLDNSSLDAKQYSVTGFETAKPEYNNVTVGLNLFGPIKIPHLLRRGPNFSIGYQLIRRNNNTVQPYLVPTLAERNGDLTGLLNALGQPVQVYSPTTGLLLPSNAIPVSPQAAALLQYYPLPNALGSTRFNYQTPLITETHSQAFNVRLDKSAGSRNQFFGGFALQNTDTTSENLFQFNDATNVLGMNTNVHWSHRFKQRLFQNVGYTFSRQSTRVTPNFEYKTNVSGAAGIMGNDQDPTNWGPPNLSFSSSLIAGLSDANSAFNRNETNGLTYEMSWNRTRHNISFGADFRRQEFNTLAQQNPRGGLGFTGVQTASPTSITTGSDFADFLLGVPDTSNIAFGNPDKYFRQSVYDAFLNDDWRVRPELTINGGVRWEYGAPLSELFGRLVNLDVLGRFAAVAPVLGKAPVGSLTQQGYPTSLVRPDKSGVEPRIGLSWRPISGSSLLIGAGYGVTYDTSVYQNIANSMAQQAPLSTSLSVANSATCRFTLANPFSTLPCTATTADTFGIDPNFRVGYAQNWKLSAQRDLPFSLQLIATYLGTKGTRGVQEFLPNTYPTGAQGPSGFYYRTSNGNSTREAGVLWLRRRLRSGFTASLQYTFAKALDDDYTLGGQGGTGSSQPAQNWLDLSAERGLSTFDQRHLLNAQLQYTTGMGIGGRTLMSGWRGLIYKEWTVLTNITVGSGLPENPVFSETVAGTGVTGPVRPSVTGLPLYSAPAGLFLNPAAFTAPATGQWGNARRNSIEGPGTFTLNASMQRSFKLRDRYSLNARLDSNNTLNHVVYTGWYTTVNSSLFGTPQSAGGMRTVTATMSLRF